jgi:hypothetical protein
MIPSTLKLSFRAAMTDSASFRLVAAAIVAAALVGNACARSVWRGSDRVEPMRPDPVPYEDENSWAVGNDTLAYQIRGEHADLLWLSVGDRLDAVLLRHRCGPAGHGSTGCWVRPGRMTVRWHLDGPHTISLRPVSAPRWRFGGAASGVRLIARSTGWTTLAVSVPEGTLREPVLVVPKAARLRIEPRQVTVRESDTAWVRIAVLDTRGIPVAFLPKPYWDGTSERPDITGRVPIVLNKLYVGGPHYFRVSLGKSRLDSVGVTILAR